MYYSKTSSDEVKIDFLHLNNLLKEYFSYKNKFFVDIEDKILQQKIDSLKYYCTTTHKLLTSQTAINDEHQKYLNQNIEQLNIMWEKITDEEQFVKTYLKTDITLRKKLFYKKR